MPPGQCPKLPQDLLLILLRMQIPTGHALPVENSMMSSLRMKRQELLEEVSKMQASAFTMSCDVLQRNSLLELLTSPFGMQQRQ